MKKTTLLFTLLGLTLITSCSTDEINSSTNEKQSQKSEKCGFANTITPTTKILITDISRGFYETIEIQGNQIMKNSSGIVPPSNYTITYSNFSFLNYEFSSLNLSQIPTYPAPSKDHLFDGAQIETLEIIHNGSYYSSQSYDRGNPPVEIKDFVNFIKSL